MTNTQFNTGFIIIAATAIALVSFFAGVDDGLQLVSDAKAMRIYCAQPAHNDTLCNNH